MTTRAIPLDAVPPVPDDAMEAPGGSGEKVYFKGSERWRITANGAVVYYIRYGPDGRQREAAYDGRRR